MASDKFRLLFSYQAYLGLRMRKVVRLNIQNINLENRELTIKTEKARVLDLLLIPEPLFMETLTFIRKHETEIQKAHGYLFYTENSKSQRAELFPEQNYVRDEFKHYMRLAGLDETYEVSEESQNRTPRTLHRLTTYSPRHYAITRFARQTNDNLVLTSSSSAIAVRIRQWSTSARASGSCTSR